MHNMALQPTAQSLRAAADRQGVRLQHENGYLVEYRDMSIEEIEGETLKLDPHERARLAGKLLESFEELSRAENERLWVEEAERRDQDMDSHESSGIPAEEVFHDARSRLK